MTELVTPTTPRPVGRSLLVQRWHDLAFLHWATDPAVVAPFLPAGTRPDTVDGVTYVGLIAFRMVGVGFLRGPGVPFFGTFCETNVRLYSVDGEGRRGVVFLSLDAARLLPVIVARASLRLPYMWSRMRLRRSADVLTYSCRRRWPRSSGISPMSEISVRIGVPVAEPSPIEHFVTARWALHTHAWGSTLHMPNDHPQWPLHRAELLTLTDTLVPATGLPPFTRRPDSVLYSPGVPVTFGTPDKLHSVRD
jgi:uncharacterized protein YqjF (DUF2071 family)